ncbi:ATP-binding protein [Allostreptomyces psammosilenae]|uniref:Histidine kinase/HSP90-like ATPase domain-containing protein n=1 Tax=Allostreptomyces psammosilenae TaxID=1892865 RepID=A0A852ZV52_9ACTN|nr:ATP-binding protein [Allostreptomyces psammosilenae]NYI06129.1 hypothetical protein [Allostreptomyces psammosilenae]
MSMMRPRVPDERGQGPLVPARGQVRRLVLGGVGGGVVARSRDFTRQALVDWGWLPATTATAKAVVEDVLLVVSELVTNACLHAGGPLELRLHYAGSFLRLEVSDGSPVAPRPRTPHRIGSPGGHGMYIVERLSHAWGVQEHDDGSGKTVWADLMPAV